MKYLFILFLLTSCASHSRALEKGPSQGPDKGLLGAAKVEPTASAKKATVEITASSRSEEKRPFRLKLEGNAIPTLAEDEALRQVDHALRADGFGPHHMGKALEIRVKFSKEASGIGGMTFGMMSSTFKHEVSLRALNGEELIWETVLVASSPQDDVRPILASMLAAGLGWYGKNSSGKKTVPLVNSEVAEKQFTQPPSRRGLLQR